MEAFDEEDDFGDLYTDIEVQATSSAHDSVPASAQLPLDSEVSDSSEANEKRFTGGGAGAGVDEEAALDLEEGQDWDSDEFESDSEDDLNIVLNDDEEDKNANAVISGFNLDAQVGGAGIRFNYEDEIGIKGEDEGNNGRGNLGGGGSGSSVAGFRLGNGPEKSQAAAVSSNLKCNGSTGVSSYSSSFVRGYWEDNCGTPYSGKNLLGAQIGRNFSLPRSRTIIDVNIDALEWKPWRLPGADITDFFNFGLDEDSWKCYCNSLDWYREQAIKGNPACNPWRHRRQDKVFSEAVIESSPSEQKRAVSQICCRQEQLARLKGEAILVEDSIYERQASVDLRQPVVRDSDVIIQIFVQDTVEELPSFVKVALDEGSNIVNEASYEGESGDIGAKDEAMVCLSSASEDGLPILKGHTEEKGTTIPERCPNDTSVSADNPVHVLSDNRGSIQVSDAHEHHSEELADSDSDETAEAKRSSDDSRKRIGSVTSNTASTERNSESHGSQGTSFSPSSSHDIKFRHGAYREPDESYDHSERASPNTESELHDSVTFDCNSSKDSRSHSTKMTSGACEYFSRGRTSIQRKLKFPERKSSRTCKVKSHLEYDNASNLRGSKKFHDISHSTTSCGDWRNSHSERPDFSSHGDLGYPISYRGKKFCAYRSSGAYSRNFHRIGYEVSGYERDQYYHRTLRAKCHFTEQRIPRFCGDAREEDLDHFDGGDTFSGLESLDFHGPEELFYGKSQFLDIDTRQKWKPEKLNFGRLLKNDNFKGEPKYSNTLTRENFRSIQYNTREDNHLQHKYDRQLHYGRGEVRSPLRGKRRYDSSCSGIETTQCRNSEDEKSRYTGGQLSFCYYKEPQTIGRVRGSNAPFSRIDIYKRSSKQGQHNCVGKCSDKTEIGFCDGIFDTDGNMKYADDQDDFAVSRHYGRSEVLEWREEKCSSWYPDYDFQAEGTFYTFDKTSRGKRSDAKCGPAFGGKRIDLSEPEQPRCELSTEGSSSSKFLESFNVSHRDIVEKRLPRRWYSTDRDRKSSRCSGAGKSRGFDRYKYFKHDEDSEQRTFKSSNDFRLKKVGQADNAKRSADTEEGQIITEDLNEKAMENPRILEIMAKMEKRRERFKEPVSLKIVSEKNDKPFADQGAETDEMKQLTRPARKRKWAGS